MNFIKFIKNGVPRYPKFKVTEDGVTFQDIDGFEIGEIFQ